MGVVNERPGVQIKKQLKRRASWKTEEGKARPWRYSGNRDSDKEEVLSRKIIPVLSQVENRNVDGHRAI